MEQIVIYLSIVLKFTNLKTKDSEIVATPLCSGNISKDWSTDNMKRTGFSGYIYDFSVDYDAAYDAILDLSKKYFS